MKRCQEFSELFARHFEDTIVDCGKSVTCANADACRCTASERGIPQLIVAVTFTIAWAVVLHLLTC